MLQNKNIKFFFKSAIGLILFSWMSYSIYHQIKRQPNLQSTVQDIFLNWDATKIVYISLVFVLMILNWTVEGIKWRLLLKGTERISILRSLQSVLTGVAVSMITPNRIGEYMGRILFLENKNKIQGVTVTIIGSFAQLIITGFLGLLGLLYYIKFIAVTPWLMVLMVSSVLLCATLGYVYFHLDKIVDFLRTIPFLKKTLLYLEIVRRFDRIQLLKILFYSLLRYIIYTLQFFILLKLLGVTGAALDIILTIWLIFWAMAIVPTIAIAEIAIRGETALFFLLPICHNEIGILSSTLLLWVINLIIPSLVGCLFAYKIKIYDNE